MSSLDASDDMLRYMSTLLRHTKNGGKTIVTADLKALRFVSNTGSNIRYVRELYKRIAHTKSEVANTKTPEERLKAVDNSYTGKLIRLPGDNDKIIFGLDNENVGDFAAYMREHGNTPYILSDMRVAEGEKPMKMVTVDKGEMNKVTDFLRSKGEVLTGKEVYVISKDDMSVLRDKYKVFVQEIETEIERNKAVEAEKSDTNVFNAVEPLTQEVTPVTKLSEEEIAQSAMYTADNPIGEMPDGNEVFQPRSDENLLWTNDSLSEPSEKGLSIKKQDDLKKPNLKSNDIEKRVSLNDSKSSNQNSLAHQERKAAVVDKTDNRAGKEIHDEYGQAFADSLPMPFDDDFLVDITDLDASKKEIIKVSDKYGFHEVGGKQFASFRNDDIGDFVLTLSPDETKLVPREEVAKRISIGDKREFHELYTRKVEPIPYKNRKPSKANLEVHKREYVKPHREMEEAKQAANEAQKLDALRDLLGNLGNKVPDVPAK